MFGFTGFWSSEQQSAEKSWCFCTDYYCTHIREVSMTKTDGLSVRCVKDAVAPSCTSVMIGGITWACTNLDVGGVFAANPYDDGAYYQWGRKSDGHESPTSQRYPTDDDLITDGQVSGAGLDATGQVASGFAAYGKFIKRSVYYPLDWRRPQTDTLWYRSGGKTVNDPCPVGWRVPTPTELANLATFANTGPLDIMNGVNGRYFVEGSNSLFLPAAGHRQCGTGFVNNLNNFGTYWSSTPEYNSNLGFSSGFMDAASFSERAYGRSVRCVAE
jgi:uncharacterized protein (TIGR02145 family)